MSDPGSGAADPAAGDAEDPLLRELVAAAVSGQYTIEGELGRGGAGVVYRARELRLRRQVALKVLPPELAYRAEVRQRFVREAQTAARLSHPNIVPIFAVDEREGLVYFAMQLVEGESLAARLVREPRPPIPVVRRVLADVADALGYAHARGVIHRDVKPDNILIDRDSGRALVTDFGIARAMEAGTRLTATGIAVGTPTYMSPEQAMGERETDARSDVYSLGVLGYQMLAGMVPFRASNTAGMLMKHISERPVPLRERRSDVPAGLAAAIERALEKEPDARWPDARSLREAILAEGAPASSASAAPPAAPARVVVGRAMRPVVEPGAPPPPVPPVDDAPLGAGDPFASATRPRSLPPYPAFPSHPNSEARELWRRQQEEWRREVRRQLADERAAGAVVPASGAPRPDDVDAFGDPVPTRVAHFAARPLDERIRAFRARAGGAAATVGFLGFINLVTFPFFPWFVFPAWGMWRGLAPYWRNLREAGVRWRDVWRGAAPGAPGARGVATAVPARPPAGADKAARRRAWQASWWDRFPKLEAKVRSFRRWLVAVPVLPLVGLAFAGIASEEAFAGMGLVAGNAALAVSGFKAWRLRRIGVRLRDTLTRTWRERLRAADPRSTEARLADEARALAAPEVLAGERGETVRQALRDRQHVRDALARMPEAERAMLPDVLPTADALVERAGALAQALHRLEQETPRDLVATIEVRLAALDREGTGADHDRRRALLERQRDTLNELDERRTQLATQLDSALLVLQQLKLDLLRLRSAGFQNALEAVTSATQEARALSKDIGFVLDAGSEARDMARLPAPPRAAPGGGDPVA